MHQAELQSGVVVHRATDLRTALELSVFKTKQMRNVLGQKN